MSRTPPERTFEQQRDADHMQALRQGTPDSVRAWAEHYSVPLVHAEDDELLLVSIHTARAQLLTGQSRRDSRAWLSENQARIMLARGGTP